MGHADFRVVRGVAGALKVTSSAKGERVSVSPHRAQRAEGRQRVFASLTCVGDEIEETRAMVVLTPELQAAFIERCPGVFTAAAGAWGERGCTLIDLRRAKVGDVRAAVRGAWGNVGT